MGYLEDFKKLKIHCKVNVTNDIPGTSLKLTWIPFESRSFMDNQEKVPVKSLFFSAAAPPASTYFFEPLKSVCLMGGHAVAGATVWPRLTAGNGRFKNSWSSPRV